ncbi:uncharacterized protein RHIMIDRAFT_281859 [Rhizopus microsporus ATCC 52813]|uniref:Uncharacterized protein n=1 Tax=Rhizopus microsporus ATCC 52813 TaxID=1340429 RepID=A0A2G4SX08_RHIZD|nr:uncharacterized protein RHIMIDRAFT_281859 [Rhizopus microsporus ATCC 52813]PHZ13282.1 hypothetical protein RHIMIDRAFT_281859 [Rhizopus microsporus ATCC 52813]
MYINKQKGTQEIVKRLLDNSKKYGTSSTQTCPLPPADFPSSSQRKRIIFERETSFAYKTYYRRDQTKTQTI